MAPAGVLAEKHEGAACWPEWQRRKWCVLKADKGRRRQDPVGEGSTVWL